MITLALNEEEAARLVRLLEMTLSDFSVEIAGTDRKAYRDEIKEKRRITEHILEKLRAARRAA